MMVAELEVVRRRFPASLSGCHVGVQAAPVPTMVWPRHMPQQTSLMGTIWVRLPLSTQPQRQWHQLLVMVEIVVQANQMLLVHR